MKNHFWKKTAAGLTALLITAAGTPAAAAQALVPDFEEAAEMSEAPFGTAGTNAPYHSKPCNERLAMLPEALMKLTPDGYSWEYTYVADKPEWPLTLMDYANIYSFIHSNDLDEATVREILADSESMVHRRAFTEEEIDLLLGDDQAAAMAAFASPSTIVIGEKGYSAKWMYCHTAEDYQAEGITPEMVVAVQPYYYNPLYVQQAADEFSQKLFRYTGLLCQTKWHQWTKGDVDLDGVTDSDDAALLDAFLNEEADLGFRQWASADMNGDSDVTEEDLAVLQSVIDAGAADNGVMLDVIEYCQYPDYPTGCESVSLFMLLDYYGVDVKVDDIYDLLPMGDQPYDDENGVRHGANPEREFVGNPRSEYSYGVFNDPIAGVADTFKPGVKTERGASVDDIKAVLDTGNPVLAWYVSAPMRDIMYRWSWVDEMDEMVYWPGGEHAVVICGYDEDSITYRDPNAGTTVCIDNATFEKSFSELGGRIVYYTDEKTEEISFVGESGSTAAVQAVVLNGSESSLGDGWYAVTGDVTMWGDLSVEGDVRLILADGASLKVDGNVSGNGVLTVYGQPECTGVFSGNKINVVGYSQFGGRVILGGEDEDTLSGSDNVRLLGGQFETAGGVYTDGTLSFGFDKMSDCFLAGNYHAGNVSVREDEALYLPDLPKDLSLTGAECSLSLSYNGQFQTPDEAALIGKLSYTVPVFTSERVIDEDELRLAQGQRLVPYPEEYDRLRTSIETPLQAEDFEIAEAEPGKNATIPLSDPQSKQYSLTIKGTGQYTGTATVNWNITPAAVSDQITVSSGSPIAYDGQPVTAEDISITASTPLAQSLLDEIDEGKAELDISIYSAAPLDDRFITNKLELGMALADGQVYDLHDLGYGFIGFFIGCDDRERSLLLESDFEQRIFVEKDGERLYGCFEINDEGFLCYNKAEDSGEEVYVEIEPVPGTYWTVDDQAADVNVTSFYVLHQDGFLEVRETEAVEPGDYFANVSIRETDGGNFYDVEKTVPFTIENDESGQIAPDETLLRWAEKDYAGKKGAEVTASVAEKKDGRLTIDLTGADGSRADSYTIDTVSGKGTDSAEETVDLPQTGNNSLRDMLLAAAAFLMMTVGGIALKLSGAGRRRNNDENC